MKMGIFSGFRFWFKPFPIQVMVYRKFHSTLQVLTFRGRYEKNVSVTDDGQEEQRNLWIRLERNNYRKVPMVPMQAQELEKGIQTVSLLQLDVNQFYPITFDKGLLQAHIPKKQPVLEYVAELDAEGKQVLDEQGKPKIKMQDGRPVVQQSKDEKGELLFETVMEPKTLLDSTIVLIDEKGQRTVEHVPVGVANKNYDDAQWMSSELQAANRINRPKSFWERNKEIIVTVLFGLFIVIVCYLTLDAYSKATAQLGGSMIEVSRQINATAGQMVSVCKGNLVQQIAQRPPIV